MYPLILSFSVDWLHLRNAHDHEDANGFILVCIYSERLTDCMEQDDCTTHAFASESGCIGDLRGFYDDDEEAERGQGIFGQTYLAVRDTVEYINTMLYFYQVRAKEGQTWGRLESSSVSDMSKWPSLHRFDST